MAIQVITTAGGTATADSLSIPIADLTGFGLTGAELTNNAAGRSRGIFSLLKRFYATIAVASGLIGLSMPNLAAQPYSTPGVNRNVYGFPLTIQLLIDKVAGTTTIVPLPSSGANAGVGGIALADIFPGITKVAATTAVTGAQILIPTSDLTAVSSGISHAGLNPASGQDNRLAIMALFTSLLNQSDVRSATIASAVTTRAFGSLSPFTIPAAYTASTNPITGIDAASVANGNKGVVSQTMSISIETLTNSANETIDINLVTL